MAGVMRQLKASSMTALKREVEAFTKDARDRGMKVRLGWDPRTVEKTEDGYAILVHVHD